MRAASFGVDRPYAGQPALRTLDGVAPRTIGGRSVERATVRVLDDDPAFAPPGHTVVQAIIPAARPRGLSSFAAAPCKQCISPHHPRWTITHIHRCVQSPARRHAP